MPRILPVTGQEIIKKFVELIGWARWGEFILVTPFINEFHIGTSRVTSLFSHLRMTSTIIRMMVAPPKEPHPFEKHTKEELLKCGHCKGIASMIILLDKYEKIVEEILIKRDLHAKVFIARNSKNFLKCMVGSINLTSAAFYKWCELGIYLEDQKVINQIINFIEIWKTRKFGPSAEIYKLWRRNFLHKYPQIKYLLDNKEVWYKWS